MLGVCISWLIILNAALAEEDKLLQQSFPQERRLLSLLDRKSGSTQFKNDIENKRSKLFPDRKRVPGRKTKYILAIVYLVHIYAVAKFLQQKRLYK